MWQARAGIFSVFLTGWLGWQASVSPNVLRHRMDGSYCTVIHDNDLDDDSYGEPLAYAGLSFQEALVSDEWPFWTLTCPIDLGQGDAWNMDDLDIVSIRYYFDLTDTDGDTEKIESKLYIHDWESGSYCLCDTETSNLEGVSDYYAHVLNYDGGDGDCDDVTCTSLVDTAWAANVEIKLGGNNQSAGGTGDLFRIKLISVYGDF